MARLEGAEQAVADAPATALEPSDEAPTGWPVDDRERRWFTSARGSFRQELRLGGAGWLSESSPTRDLPGAARRPSTTGIEPAIREHTELVRSMVDARISFLRELARLLAVLQGTPRTQSLFGALGRLRADYGKCSLETRGRRSRATAVMD